MAQPAHRSFLPGHVVVITCSLTVQLFNMARTIHLEQHERYCRKIAIFVILGLLFLSYPLLGYIADVCLTRYRTLKCFLIFLIVGCTIALLPYFVAILVGLTEMFVGISIFDKANRSVEILPVIPLIALITTGVGLFEANAIQFGMDQLLEAPTPKLIAFIHWYYWTHNVVQLVVMYITRLSFRNRSKGGETIVFFYHKGGRESG